MNRVVFLFIFLFRCIYAQEPIHLVWLGGCSPEHMWETDWIQEVLSKVEGEIHVVRDIDYTVFLDRSILIVAIPQPHEQKSKVQENCKKYFKKCKKKGLRFGVIHISDEYYHDSTEFYPDAKFVIRNYWHEKFAGTKTLFFPLGYKRGFWKDFKGDIKTVAQRKYQWSFAGQVKKSTRASMIDNMKKIPTYHIHEIGAFNAPDSLNSQKYRDLLLETTFVPCPRGWWNLDSFRIAEALECGCIPIVEKSPFDYFQKFFGSYPFPSVSSWDEAPALINDLLEHPDKLEKLRTECHQWWISYKDMLQDKVADLVEKEF